MKISYNRSAASLKATGDGSVGNEYHNRNTNHGHSNSFNHREGIDLVLIKVKTSVFVQAVGSLIPLGTLSRECVIC